MPCLCPRRATEVREQRAQLLHRLFCMQDLDHGVDLVSSIKAAGVAAVAAGLLTLGSSQAAALPWPFKIDTVSPTSTSLEMKVHMPDPVT